MRLESAQMVIDKARTWHALQVASYLNARSDIWYGKPDYPGMAYDICNGDKDTFHIAWRKTNTPLAVCPYSLQHTSPVVLYQLST